MVTLAETLRADEVLLTVHQVAENCMATIDRGFGRASAALNPARRDFARTLRWRKPDSNSESRSEKAFHAEPMVCTTLRWSRQSGANRSLEFRFPGCWEKYRECHPDRETIS